ncbi:unnamed protein product, partial [Coregonus sp. 'balchen']
QADLQAVCPSRRRSCALVNTPSLCVNKAVCHIQELKKQLENWCQQAHETFSKTFNELKRFQEAISKEELKADEERGFMFHELKGIRNLLNDRLWRLAGEAAVSHSEEVFRKKHQDTLDLHEENKEELSQMATLHANTKVNLEELEQKTFMVEQRMRVCADLKVALKEKVELAHEYRDLKNALMIAKQEAVLCLSLLPKRMHKAVVKYFRQRSLYSLAELARFQNLSNENNHKIKTIQCHHTRVKDATATLPPYIQSSQRQHSDVIDDVSARAPMACSDPVSG